MIWWWIGNIVLIFAVLPVVLLLLNGILGPIEQIRFTVDEIYDNASHLHGMLTEVPPLLQETDETVREVAIGATRYEQGVERLLSQSG